MLTREERFYERAMKELTEQQPAQGAWAKAFSMAVGDEQKAKALYLKMRAEQMEREHQASIGDSLRFLRAEVEAGRPFVCPYCETRTVADYAERSFVQGSERYRYSCRNCGTELCLYGQPVQTASPFPAAAIRRNNPMAVTGFVLGLASMILYAIGIIPILAVVFSGIGLATFKPGEQKNKWMAGVGLAIGAVYVVLMLDQRGH